MRGFVALFRREARELRWHFVAAAVLGGAVPFVLYGCVFDASHWTLTSGLGGRVTVPILFALFAMATASDLVARDVATRRIDALAVLPVPGSLVWRAKLALLAVSSAAFLVWIVAAEWVALRVVCPPGAAELLAKSLVRSVPLLLGGLALGAAALFLSTMIERAMSAALGAVVLIVGIVAAVQFARMPAAFGASTTFALYAVPAGLAAAFTFAARTAFVHGPIHGPSKLRVALAGFATLLGVALPGSAALAFGLTSAADLAPGEGEASRRAAFVSPDGKWVAVEDVVGGGAARTWIVGIDGAQCRSVVPGTSWFIGDGAWTAGGMLRVRTSTFSLLAGPQAMRQLEIEPSKLTAAEDEWLEPGTSPRWHKQAPGESLLADGRRVVTDGEVTLRAADGSLIRRLFPPQSAGEKGN